MQIKHECAKCDEYLSHQLRIRTFCLQILEMLSDQPGSLIDVLEKRIQHHKRTLPILAKKEEEARWELAQDTSVDGRQTQFLRRKMDLAEKAIETREERIQQDEERLRRVKASIDTQRQLISQLVSEIYHIVEPGPRE